MAQRIKAKYRFSLQLFESDDWIQTKYIAYLLLSSRDNNNAILRPCSIQLTDGTLLVWFILMMTFQRNQMSK